MMLWFFFGFWDFSMGVNSIDDVNYWGLPRTIYIYNNMGVELMMKRDSLNIQRSQILTVC